MAHNQFTSRELVDRIIHLGRGMQSPQTGLIHLNYQAFPEEQQYSIPFVENFLFSLALLRSRLAENIQEAKQILGRLLEFQVENFPVYLDEYPRCSSRYIGLDLLPSIYQILKVFRSVLGKDLLHSMEVSSKSLLDFLIDLSDKHQAPKSFTVKLAAFLHTFSPLLDQPLYREKAEQLIQKYRGDEEWASSCNTQVLGDLCLAASFWPEEFERDEWKDFWAWLASTWDPIRLVYCGPCFQEKQEGHEMAVNLYDYFLIQQGSLQWTKRIQEDSPTLFKALWAKRFDHDLSFSGDHSKKDQKMFYKISPNYSVSIFQKQVDELPLLKNLMRPLHMTWGNEERLHSLDCQVAVAGIDFEEKKEAFDLIFTLPEEVDLDDRIKSRELAFYLDLHEKVSIVIGEKRANTFRLGEEVFVQSGDLHFSLVFEIEEGEGEFMGHIQPGNRPAQGKNKGVHRYDAYDMQIFLRSITRSSPCKIRASLRIR